MSITPADLRAETNEGPLSEVDPGASPSMPSRSSNPS